MKRQVNAQFLNNSGHNIVEKTRQFSSGARSGYSTL